MCKCAQRASVPILTRACVQVCDFGWDEDPVSCALGPYILSGGEQVGATRHATSAVPYEAGACAQVTHTLATSRRGRAYRLSLPKDTPITIRVRAPEANGVTTRAAAGVCKRGWWF